MQKIILASQSENRKRLFQALNIPFTIIISDFDESQVKEKDLRIRAQKIAVGKARRVAQKHPGIIIAADTFTVCEGEILEKPKDKKEAKRMLKFLSDKEAACYTGFCFLDVTRLPAGRQGNKEFSKTAVTKIKFRQIYEKELEKYLQIFPVTSWAAAYAIINLYLFSLVGYISGSFTGLTHGLPTEFLIPVLKEAGYTPSPA